MEPSDKRLANALIVYLLLFGLGSAVTLIRLFPQTDEDQKLQFLYGLSADQGLIIMAMLGGMTGSFLHAAQSLISFIGNKSFKSSWGPWYALRPWIGAILGLTIYFAFRAGFISGPNAANPYGVVAIGLLGGWFSKTTTDKLQEVFETMFTTAQDAKRKDKLELEQPIIDSVTPSPVPPTTNDLEIIGKHFHEGAKVVVDAQEIDAMFISSAKLKATVAQRPAAGTNASVHVKNPHGLKANSEPVLVIFE